MRKLMLLVVANLWFGHCFAATHATSCHGCDRTGMYDAAVRTTTGGIVYVFDATDGEVRKFLVATEVVGFKPYQAYTWGEELLVESDIKSGFRDFSSRLQGSSVHDAIDLPPDFPIRSVAGAMLEPDAARIYVTDHIRHLENYEQMTLTVNTLVSAVLSRNIPLLNLSQIFSAIKVIVRFPDGSTMEFEIYFTINGMSSEASLELKLIGNARQFDGLPAPTSGYGFRDFYTDDQGQAVYEWARWATQNGVPVHDPTGGQGTRMSCEIDGSYIHCTVYGRRN